MYLLSRTTVTLLLGLHYFGLHQRQYESGVYGAFIIKGLPKKKYIQLGDINFGSMFRITRRGTVKLCTDTTYDSQLVKFADILRYAVKHAQKDIPLPNNLTLGFIVLDECGRKTVASAQALSFLPQTTCPVKGNSQQSDIAQEHYDVVTVIAASTSQQSIAVANVLGPARVPQIGVFASTDQLSNKRLYPYFMRLLPADRFQAQAIVSILKVYNWSYVSVLYKEDIYGKNGLDKLTRLFKANGICLAVVRSMSLNMSDAEVGETAQHLVDHHRKASVVVVYTNDELAIKVILATASMVPNGTFVWIVSEGWSHFVHKMKGIGDLLLGSLLIKIQTSPVADFDNWFRHLRPSETPNPWFREYLERLNHCSIERGTCPANMSASDCRLLRSSYSFTGHIIDAVYMIANATLRVLRSSDCNGLRGTAARACVTGPRMLRELKATKQTGYSGWLEVDDNGDRQGRFHILQLRPGSDLPYSELLIAEFDSLTGQMSIVNNASWENNTVDEGFTSPVSQCSFPCKPHEKRAGDKNNIMCCWTCSPCAKNERLINNGTECHRCKNFSWPDPDTANTTCVPITPNTMRFDSAAGIVQTNLGMLGLFACVFVFIFFIRHRDCRVIKASSKELSYMMLLGITIGYVAVITFLAPASTIACMINFLLFCTSFTLMYGSLLVRTLRIYRLIEEGKKSTRRPRLTDSSHQIFFSLFVLLVQMVICTAVMISHPRWHKKSQTSALEPYVEHTCDLPTAGLMYFLYYNMLLVAVCALLAFKSRNLPINFNESRFIALCVYSTLVISICFIPTYLVSSRELLKVMILSMVLGLNHSVALVFLFIPKMFAVVYQSDNSNRPARLLPPSSSLSRLNIIRKRRVVNDDSIGTGSGSQAKKTMSM